MVLQVLRFLLIAVPLKELLGVGAVGGAVVATALRLLGALKLLEEGVVLVDALDELLDVLWVLVVGSHRVVAAAHRQFDQRRERLGSPFGSP